MNIALIGPGIMDIPAVGWGAVENIIWQYALELDKLGHSVDIYNNKDLSVVANQINSKTYDMIHLHYDEYIEFFNKNLKQPFIATSHFGYILQPEMWQGYYHSIFNATLQTNSIIALWDKIAKVYIDNNYKGKLYTLRNGAETSKFKTSTNPIKDVICVGKVESRKLQVPLANMIDNHINCDIVGPIGDTSITDGATVKYIGSWNKDQLYQNLTNYKVGTLISIGEAAPLVVPEYMAAGLSVVVSKEAAANLDDKPWIYIIDRTKITKDELINIYNRAISENSLYREDIIKYARERFDWSVIIKEYIDIITKIKEVK